MADPYYTFYPGDYLRDTQDLTLIEHGAYRIILDHYYCNRGLTAVKSRLYIICKAITSDEQAAVDFIVNKFFKEVDGELKNKRADKEILKRDQFIEIQREKGKRSAEKRWSKDNPGYNPGYNPGSTPVVTGEVTEGVTEGQPKSNQPSPSPSPSLKDKYKESAPENGAVDLSLDEGMTEQGKAHYSKVVGDFLPQLETLAGSFKTLPPRFKHPFNPYQFIQKYINEGYHPQVILDALKNISTYWNSITGDPWQYSRKFIYKSQKQKEAEGWKKMMPSDMSPEVQEALKAFFSKMKTMPENETEKSRRAFLAKQAALLKQKPDPVTEPEKLFA